MVMHAPRVQDAYCLHYTYGFPWFAEDQKSHGV